MKLDNYTDALLSRITPELKMRLTKLAENEKISLGEMIVKILSEGVSTSAFLVAAGNAPQFFATGC